MNFARHHTLKLLSSLGAATMLRQALPQQATTITPGRFANTRASLPAYTQPRLICRRQVRHLVALEPAGSAVIQSLTITSPQKPDKVADVRMLGRDKPLRFAQDATGLRIMLLPADKPATADIGFALKINFA